MKTVSGKKILMIGVKFYFYNDEIIKKLKSMNAEVEFFYERDITIRHAIIDTFFPRYMETWQDKHYGQILESIKGKKFDYLLVIRGYKMPLWFVDGVRKQNPDIKTIMYQWDSVQNFDYREKLPYFDFCSTFDYEDAKRLNLTYIPTFHIDEFKNLEPVEIEYDLFFYGNFTRERYEKVIELIDIAQQKGYRLKRHLFMSYKRFLLENSRGAKLDKKYINFSRMGKTEYLQLFKQSNIIVDITTTAQSGLAMRVLDTLGAGKKLITNNVHIKQESYYNPDQIFVIEDGNLDIPASFFEIKTFPKIDYSLDKWVENIFGGL